MFDRAPTFHVGAHIFGLRIICVWRSCFLDLEYFMSANIFIDADILGRRHFRAPTFQGADILGRRHFRAPTF